MALLQSYMQDEGKNILRSGEAVSGGGMYSYCLFCETQKCDAVAHIIQNTYGIRCISPKIIQRKWVKGKCLEERHDWLPGYVFLYSEDPIHPDFHVNGVIRWLEYTELQGRDNDYGPAGD